MRNSVELYIALQDKEKEQFIKEKGQEEYDRLVTHLLTVPSVKDWIKYVNGDESLKPKEAVVLPFPEPGTVEHDVEMETQATFDEQSKEVTDDTTGNTV